MSAITQISKLPWAAFFVAAIQGEGGFSRPPQA